MGRLFQSYFLIHLHGQHSSPQRMEWLGWPKAWLVSSILHHTWNPTFSLHKLRNEGLILCLIGLCVSGEYIMENTSVVGQELTWLEVCHGHGYWRMKRPSLLLECNSLNGTLGLLAPKQPKIIRWSLSLIIAPDLNNPSTSLITSNMVKMKDWDLKLCYKFNMYL